MGCGDTMRISRKLSLVGILTSLAVVLAVLEQYVPIQLIFPLPGIKLGIANVVTLTALKKLDFKCAFAILVVRCCLVSLLFGTPISLAMSLSGGLLSLCMMWLLLRRKTWFSIYGVSIAGAAMHNIGQVACACVVLKSVYVFGYLPILLVSAFFTGALIGILVSGCFRVLKN